MMDIFLFPFVLLLSKADIDIPYIWHMFSYKSINERQEGREVSGSGKPRRHTQCILNGQAHYQNET